VKLHCRGGYRDPMLSFHAHPVRVGPFSSFPTCNHSGSIQYILNRTAAFRSVWFSQRPFGT
jgi:hypothetical protein